MSNQWTDAELVRICLEDPIDKFTDELVGVLTDRIKTSDSLRSSVLESENSASILGRLNETRESLTPKPVRSTRGSVSVMALIAACLLGFSVAWLMRNDKPEQLEQQQPDVANPSPWSDSDNSADKQTQAATDSQDGSENTANDVTKTNDDPDKTGVGQPTDTNTDSKTADATNVPDKPDDGSTGNANSKPDDKGDTPVKIGPQVAWAELFDLSKPALTFEQAAWRLPGVKTPDVFKPEQFQAWFESIPGRPWGLIEANVSASHYTRFDGQARLKAPWVEGAVMRLTPYDIERCSMFFWRGDEGVRIRFYRSRAPHVWAAHRATRNKGHVEVNELLTSDNGRWSRTYFGTFEVRSQDGDIIMMRGDMPLLKVALGGLPEQVVLEGKLKLRQLEFYRSDPVPEKIVNKLRMPMGRLVAGGDVRAHDWQTNFKEQATFEKLPKLQVSPPNKKDNAEVADNGDGKTENIKSGPAAVKTTQIAAEKTGADQASKPGDSVNENDATKPGIVRLSSAADSTTIAWANFAVPDAGLSEFVFQVKHADPGTGFYLGDKTGEPQYQIGYVWDPNARHLAYSYLSRGQKLLEKAHSVDAFPPPFTAPSQYVRVVIGSGILTMWISADGEHWGWMGDYPTTGLSSRQQTIGIYALPGAKRSIELSKLEVREFPFVAKLAEPELLKLYDPELFEPLELRDFGSWLHVVSRTKPIDQSFDAWRRTCAVQTLRRVPNSKLMSALWHGLLTDRAFKNFDAGTADHPAVDHPAGGAMNPPAAVVQHADDVQPAGNANQAPDKQAVAQAAADEQAESEADIWGLLAEASLFINTYDGTVAGQFSVLYHSIVERIVARNSESPGQAGNEAVLRTTDALVNFAVTPNWTSAAIPITSTKAAKLELMLLVQQQKHADALRLIDRLVFWNSNGHPNYSWWSPIDSIYTTVAWAELAAHKSLDSDEQTERISRPRRWKTTLLPLRHPLAQPVNKEAYNVMAEFNAALSGDAFNDACQVIASAGDANTLGLLPDRADERLLIAFPRAVAIAMDEHPELRSSMNDRYGAVGQLRVREAMKIGDANQIEAATVQFFGTIAAAECEQWLGDRAMSAGRFEAARKHFADALAGYQRNSPVETAETKGLQSRLQLVQSMLGVPVSDTSQLAASQFGSQAISVAQMKALMTELSQTANSQSGRAAAVKSSAIAYPVAQAAPQLLAHQSQVRANFDGDHGEHAGRSGPSTVNWFSRQLAFAQEGQLLYLADRFQLRCLDLTTGVTKWKQDLGAEHGNAHYWPLHPMRPLITNTHIFYRRYTKLGAELASFEKATGKLVWRFKPPNALVSDPFFVRGRLQILASEKATAGPVQIRLLTVHPQTGVIVEDVSILQLLDETQLPEHLTQVTVHDDQVIFTVSGAVACCDGQGQPLWVRRQSWTIPALDPTRVTRAWQPPIVVGDTVIVSQPGVRMLECIDASTGRLVWTFLAPELKRIVGTVGNRMVLETSDGFEAVNMTNGRRQWRYTTPYLNDAAMLTTRAVSSDPKVPPQNVLLCVRHRDIGRAIRRPEFVWVDLETGNEVAYAPLSNLDDKQPRLGPFVSFQNRLFAFFGKGYKTPNRELVEFTPQPDAQAYRSEKTRWTSWLPSTADSRILNPKSGINLARTSHSVKFLAALPHASPGWSVSAPTQAADAGFKDNVQGRNQVFAIKLAPRKLDEAQQTAFAVAPMDTVRLIRDVAIPKDPNASLRLTVGHDKGNSWQLIIEAEGCRLHSSIIDDKSAPNGWQDINLTFGHLCGKQVQLIIAGAPVQPAKTTWVYFDGLKSFEIK